MLPFEALLWTDVSKWMYEVLALRYTAKRKEPSGNWSPNNNAFFPIVLELTLALFFFLTNKLIAFQILFITCTKHCRKCNSLYQCIDLPNVACNCIFSCLQRLQFIPFDLTLRSFLWNQTEAALSLKFEILYNSRRTKLFIAHFNAPRRQDEIKLWKFLFDSD